MMKRYIIILLGLASIFFACQPEDDFSPNEVEATIYDRLMSAKSSAGYDSLLIALSKTGLDQRLREEQNITFIAPRNDAFRNANMRPSKMTAQQLLPLLNYHLIRESVEMNKVTAMTSFNTEQGNFINVSAERWNRSLNGTDIQNRDIAASNGMLQTVNTMLSIPHKNVLDTATAKGWTTFVQAVDRAGLRAELTDPGNPVTVFIPTNAAFTTFLITRGFGSINAVPVEDLRNILLYHVLPGRNFLYDIRKPFRPYFTEEFSPGADANVTVLPSILMKTANNAELEFINAGNINLKGKSNTAEISRNPSGTGNNVGNGLTATNGVIHVISGVLLP